MPAALHTGFRQGFDGTSLPSLAQAQHCSSGVRAVEELAVVFRPLFKFRYFNVVQSEAFDQAHDGDANLVQSLLHELAVVRVTCLHTWL